MSIADNIALINHGAIEDYGPPERIYLRPATLFTAKFMGESNIINAEISGQDDDLLKLSTKLGEIALPGAGESGAERSVVLRPEQIKIGTHDASERLIALGECKVSEIIFQGTHKVLYTQGGQGMDTHIQLRAAPDFAVVVGDMLEIYAEASDAVLLTH